MVPDPGYMLAGLEQSLELWGGGGVFAALSTDHGLCPRAASTTRKGTSVSAAGLALSAVIPVTLHLPV